MLQLKEYYNGYALCNTVNFNSWYSIRIFEILKSCEFKADARGYFSRSFEYQELREMLGIEKNEYKLFADFRINVVSVAVKEINANPDISVLQVEYQKTGRKVSHIVFHCERVRQIQIKFDESPQPSQEKSHPEYIAELIAIGIDEQTAYRWKRKYTVARLRDAIAYTKAMQDSKKIKESITGFLVHAVTNNIGTSWVADNQKKIKIKQEQNQIDETKLKESQNELIEGKKKTKNLLDTFHTFPDQEQQIIRHQFETQIGEFLLPYWSREKESNSKPEKNSKFSAKFASFFESYQANLQRPI